MAISADVNWAFLKKPEPFPSKFKLSFTETYRRDIWWYGHSLKLDSDSMTWNSLGNALLMTGDIQDAMRCYNEAYRLGLQDADLGRCLVLILQGERREASEILSAYIALREKQVAPEYLRLLDQLLKNQRPVFRITWRGYRDEMKDETKTDDDIAIKLFKKELGDKQPDLENYPKTPPTRPKIEVLDEILPEYKGTDTKRSRRQTSNLKWEF